METKLDPDTLVREIGGEAFERLLGPLHEPPQRRLFIGNQKLAPFTASLDQSKDTIAILTGSGAWQRGKSKSHWFSCARLLLPFGELPDGYLWAVDGKDCLIFGFDEAELLENLNALSVELLASGAERVQWMGQFTVDSEMIDGDLYRIGETSSRLYKKESAS
jgi:hypothetical protein